MSRFRDLNDRMRSAQWKNKQTGFMMLLETSFDYWRNSFIVIYQKKSSLKEYRYKLLTEHHAV